MLTEPTEPTEPTASPASGAAHDPHVKPVVRLMNDIWVQFRREPVAVAAEAIAGYIRQFWVPGMRSQLIAISPSDEYELDERGLAAVGLLRVAADSRP